MTFYFSLFPQTFRFPLCECVCVCVCFFLDGRGILIPLRIRQKHITKKKNYFFPKTSIVSGSYSLLLFRSWQLVTGPCLCLRCGVPMANFWQLRLVSVVNKPTSIADDGWVPWMNGRSEWVHVVIPFKCSQPSKPRHSGGFCILNQQHFDTCRDHIVTLFPILCINWHSVPALYETLIIFYAWLPHNNALHLLTRAW